MSHKRIDTAMKNNEKQDSARGANTSAQRQQGGDSGRHEITRSSERSRGTGSQSGLTRYGEGGLAPWSRNPMETMARMMSEMDQMMSRMGLGRGWMMPTLGSPFSRSYEGLAEQAGSMIGTFSPEVEVFRRENELVVRADVPGLQKENLHVEVRDDHVLIEGERREEQQENREGYLMNERRYGRFQRAIPLPEGVNPEDAKATFRDGVLEVTMPAPLDQSTGRGREVPIE
jgi:HSP20 family protein